MKRFYVPAMAAVLLAAASLTGCGSRGDGAAAPSAVEAEDTGSAGETEGTDGSGQTAAGVAAGDETVAPEDLASEGMTPVYAGELKDGVYPITVDSSSSMFNVTECELTVADGQMSARMIMGGTGYLKLYMGTGEKAAEGRESDFIPYEETEDGRHSFTVPVKALDMEIPCSAFSKDKEKWYDRILVFRSDSLPLLAFQEEALVTADSLGLEDGEYTVDVALSGGSGRASVKSPASVRVSEGKAFVTVEWGSSNYDYMKLDGQRYEPLEGYETSAFELPVPAFDRRIAVIADTVAMSQPHEIDYTLILDSKSLERTEAGAEESSGKQPAGTSSAAAPRWGDMDFDHHVKLSYADQFSIDTCDGGWQLISIEEGGRFLTVPEGKKAPADLPEDVTALYQPMDHIYMAATSAMDLFASMGGVDRITLSGTEASGWYVDSAREAMEAGKMVYAGKYSAPDYERILEDGCDLAVESTMIYHSPEVKEKLEALGIPVLVERSSYEGHPLGRMEWVKLYGALLGKSAEAEKQFDDLAGQAEAVMNQAPTGKTVAFFYINSNGAVNVRKPGDYVAKMIAMAGGEYVPGDLKDDGNALSTMNMQMEAFYAAARDADYIIYNSTIDGELKTVDQLLEKSSLLADFKAVKEGNAWCTGKNMFQETMGTAGMILDIHRMLTEKHPDPEEFSYLHRLQ